MVPAVFIKAAVAASFLFGLSSACCIDVGSTSVHLDLMCPTSFESRVSPPPRVYQHTIGVWPALPNLTLSGPDPFPSVMVTLTSLNTFGFSGGVELENPAIYTGFPVCVAPLPGGGFTEVRFVFEVGGYRFLGPAPRAAMEHCLKTLNFLIWDWYPTPPVLNFLLNVTGLFPDATNASIPVAATATSCEGFGNASPPVAVAAAPGTVPAGPPASAPAFRIYADSGCNVPVPILKDIVIPSDDPQDVLGSFEIGCGRADPPAEVDAIIPLPGASTRCAVALLHDVSIIDRTYYRASAKAGYKVFLSGHNETAVPLPDGTTSDVTWTPFLSFFYGRDTSYTTTCTATRTVGGATGKLERYFITYSEPLLEEVLRGPAPIWAFEACLRTLYTDPAGMPDNLGTYFLNLTAVTRLTGLGIFPGQVESAPVTIPFDVVSECPPAAPIAARALPQQQAQQQREFGELQPPRITLEDDPSVSGKMAPVSIDWHLRCTDDFFGPDATAIRALPKVAADLVDFIVRINAVEVIEDVKLSFVCSNCLFTGERVKIGPPYSDILSAGELRYTERFPLALPQRAVFPNVTVHTVTDPPPSAGGVPLYGSCSALFPAFDFLPQSVGLGNITVSRDSTLDPLAGTTAAGSPVVFSLQLGGRVAAPELYSTCLFDGLAFLPYFRAASEAFIHPYNFSLGTTARTLSFVVFAALDGYQGSFPGSPRKTFTAIAPATIVVSNEDCLERPMAKEAITPVFLDSTEGLVWPNAHCEEYTWLPVFYDSDISFVVDALPSPPDGGGGGGDVPPPPSPESFLGGVQVTCLDGLCPDGLYYFTTGGIPFDDPLRKLVSWPYSGGGCDPDFSTCYLLCRYVSGPEAGAPVYDLLMNTSSILERPGDSGFSNAEPLLLFSRDLWVPSTAFEACLKDLRITHPWHVYPPTPEANTPFPAVPELRLLVTALRSDMTAIVARNSSVLVISVPVTPTGCSPGVAGSSTNVAAIVAPAVVVPVAAALAVAGLLVMRRNNKRKNSRRAAAASAASAPLPSAAPPIGVVAAVA